MPAMINLRLLKAFVTVADCGSVTRAAEMLHISQPALTRQIQELEEMFSSRLFERSRRGLTLTESGCLLEVRAKELLSLAERTRHEMLEAGGLVGGIVRVGCVETSASAWVAAMLAEFRSNWPKAQFEVYSGDGDDIRNLLDEDRLDVGVLLEPVETAKYESFVIPPRERWGVVVGSESEWAAAGAVPRKALPGMSLILPRRHIVLDALREWFGEDAAEIRVAGYHNIPTNGLLLVKQGLGGLLCVEGSIAIRPAEGLAFVPITPEKRSAQRMVRKRGRGLAPAAENFWRLCAENAAGAGEPEPV